ncbi:hypothetical protein K2173_001715 [Erythroxylum novogranatense]|uniref:Uncharacterized protein n=1 Tax=Erythroxylum novogranatense TaxID=1862640 RepID=A0AAV8S7X3_9ROSI|nr:hypothetical protein K2173_001715 [Erythroxylum novogranatense]
MVQITNHINQPSNPTSPTISKSSSQIHHHHGQASNDYFKNILESFPSHRQNAHYDRKHSSGSPKFSPVPRSHNQSDYWKQLLEFGIASHNEKKHLSEQSVSSAKSLAIAPESCASYPDISLLDESLLDGRRSAPPDFQELRRSQQSSTSLIANDPVKGSSSSSSSSSASELSSSSSSPELESQPTKRTYLDAALTISNFKQKPSRQPSSSAQGQPSGDRNSENIRKATLQKIPSLKPPSGSTKSLIKFGTVDETLIRDCSQYSAVTFISQPPKARNVFRSISSCKPSSVLPRTMSYADGLSIKDNESQVQQARPLLRKYSADFMESVACASGNNILERCNSCSNPLKHCCSQTILTTVLAKSSST